VSVNAAAAAAYTVLFLRGEYGGWSPGLAAGASGFFLLLAASFYALFMRTRLWKLTHTRSEDLDEREIQLTHRAFRISYTLFAVISTGLLVLLFVTVRYSFLTLTFRGHYSLGLILLFLVNYLINTLPAAVIAWTEERI
jgi:hypothetical protein